MDGISALSAGAAVSRADFQVAALKLALGDLPTETIGPGSQAPSSFVASPPSGIDVAEQLTTVIVSAGVHRATTAAMRSMLSMYQASADMVSPTS